MALTEAGIMALISGISAAGSITSASIQGGRGKRAREEAMKYNTAEAKKSREFTREMFGRQMEAANTAYQRGSEDMKKAGLNPMVLMGGASADFSSAQGAATGSINAPAEDWSGFGDVAESAISSGLEAKMVRLQEKQINEGIKKVAAETKMSDAAREKIEAETENIKKIGGKGGQIDQQNLNLQIQNAERQLAIKKINEGWETWQLQNKYEKNQNKLNLFYQAWDNAVKKGKDVTELISEWVGMSKPAKLENKTIHIYNPKK